MTGTAKLVANTWAYQLDALDVQVGAIARITGYWAGEWPEPVRIAGVTMNKGKLNIWVSNPDGSDVTDGFTLDDICMESAWRPSQSEARREADVAEAVAVIDDMIDLYSIAGANLLHWLDADDLERMPKPKGRPAGLPWNMPTSTDWENWASDVACRKFFEALHKAKEAIRAAQQEPEHG